MKATINIIHKVVLESKDLSDKQWLHIKMDGPHVTFEKQGEM